MVYNLCDNAVKYNRPGGSVNITVENKTITVADTGIGIPLSSQPRVFERFYRVDKSHSKEIGGTGLGLSIVKHAAIYHGAKSILKASKTPEQKLKSAFRQKSSCKTRGFTAALICGFNQSSFSSLTLSMIS